MKSHRTSQFNMNMPTNKMTTFVGLRACFKIVGGRRVRARGLQEMAKIVSPCRPGPPRPGDF